MMERQQIESELKAIINDYFDSVPDHLAPEDNIVQSLELNSLTKMELVVLTNKHLGVMIPLQDFASIVTFGDLYEYIYTHQA